MRNPLHSGLSPVIAKKGADFSYDVCLVFPAVRTDSIVNRIGKFDRRYLHFEVAHVHLIYVIKAIPFSFREKMGKNEKTRIHAVPQGGLEIYTSILGMFGTKFVKLYLSQNKKQFYLLIGASMHLLKRTAQVKKVMLPLNEVVLKELALTGWPDEGVEPLSMNSRYRNKKTGEIVRVSSYNPYEHMFGKYKVVDEMAELYNVPPRNQPFTDDIRLPLLRRLLDEPVEVGGLEIRMKQAIIDGDLIAAFPLHDKSKLDALARSWTRNTPWSQPYDDIKEYFGAKIAIYSLFVG